MSTQRAAQYLGTSRAIYRRPQCRNILGAIQISIPFPQAMLTPKVFTVSVGLPWFRVDVQALMANLAGMARINQNQLHSEFDCLVCQKQPQLIERPAIRSTSLSPRAWQLIGAFPDAGQILQRDSLAASFGALHNPVADSMVHPTLKPPFTSTQPLQKFSAPPPRTPCAFGRPLLYRCPHFAEFISNSSDLFARERIPVTRHSNICAPQINSQNSSVSSPSGGSEPS